MLLLLLLPMLVLLYVVCCLLSVVVRVRERLCAYVVCGMYIVMYCSLLLSCLLGHNRSFLRLFTITTKTNLSLPSDTPIEIMDVHKGIEVLAG